MSASAGHFISLSTKAQQRVWRLRLDLTRSQTSRAPLDSINAKQNVENRAHERGKPNDSHPPHRGAGVTLVKYHMTRGSDVHRDVERRDDDLPRIDQEVTQGGGLLLWPIESCRADSAHELQYEPVFPGMAVAQFCGHGVRLLDGR